MRWMRRARARWKRLPTWLVDGGIVALVIAVDLTLLAYLVPVVSQIPGWGFRGSSAAAVPVVLATRLPLLLRRRYPRVVLAVVTTLIVLERLMELPTSDLATYVALFTVAIGCTRRQALAALGLLVVVRGVVALEVNSAFLLLDVLSFLVSWVLGDRQQAYRALLGELQCRTEQLEREREDKARLAAADERARIARDLHDVVAHSVSVMVLHAAAARRTLSKDPARAEEAMAQVEATGRQSLTELRRLLGVLRDGQHTELSPAPQLAYLDDLIDQFRAAGLPVQVEITGEAQPLAPGVDLSAYRIIQEALTNALKHAHPAAVTLTLRYTPRDLQVEVLDDGRTAAAEEGAGSNGGGHGLVGMRERAGLVGGQLQAGPRPGGGFGIAATLPLET
ncbi:MAG: histidine kinase [Actinomycetota bacterium]|nr:histidine kinase [Actinomycetota bacterium]